MTSNPLAEIEHLLAEPLAQVEERERSAFARLLAGTDGSVVLFGAGRVGRLCARALGKASVPLRAFCDGNPALQGTRVAGVPVLHPATAAAQFGGSSLFCVAIWTGAARESMASRCDFLRGIGCRHVAGCAPLIWAHGRSDLPFHSFDLPSRLIEEGATQLLELARGLADEASREVLTATLRQRLLGQFSPVEPSEDQYFVPGISEPGADEVFVDGGAYTGDTLADFIRRTNGSFRAYHAFEPDPKNLAALQAAAAALPVDVRSRVKIHAAGLFSRGGTVSFASDIGVSSAIAADGGASIPVVELDSLQLPVSFLKLDIEGAEPDALKGAARTLATHQPTVAVCVYHNPSDLWVIPALLRHSLPKHKFYLRQHGYDGWEIVLYAIKH